MKNTIKINEGQLAQIVAESVKRALSEGEQLGVDSSRDFIYEFNDAARKFEGGLKKYLERYPGEVLSTSYGNAVFRDLNVLRNSISEFYQATYEA